MCKIFLKKNKKSVDKLNRSCYNTVRKRKEKENKAMTNNNNNKVYSKKLDYYGQWVNYWNKVKKNPNVEMAWGVGSELTVYWVYKKNEKKA